MIQRDLLVAKFVAAIALLSLPALCHAASQEKVLFNLPQCDSGTCPTEPATADRGLIFDKSGNLYGVYQFSGSSGSKCEGYGCGFVFKLTLGKSGTWSESVLYNFCSATNCSDGAIPSSALAFDSAGNLYGTTWYGGSTISACGGLGCGVVYKLTPGTSGKWTETVLYSFTGSSDGAEPAGTTPILDSTGNLYGTTSLGGAHAYGTVFKLTPSASGFWKETVLHSFNLNGTDGILPIGLAFDSSGNLYGATGGGGKYSGTNCVNTQISDPRCGTVYRLTPSTSGDGLRKSYTTSRITVLMDIAQSLGSSSTAKATFTAQLKLEERTTSASSTNWPTERSRKAFFLLSIPSAPAVTALGALRLPV